MSLSRALPVVLVAGIWMALSVFPGPSQAQVPVEAMAGHQRTTIDVMFFRYFKTRTGDNSPWLFFNRNRAAADYRISGDRYLPQFGFTEALSYNHPKMKGVAPVAVVQVLNAGVYPKAGLQYALIRKDFTLFTWLVAEALRQPDLDHFLLARFTPPVAERLHLFLQAETVSAFPTHRNGAFRLTQRLRLGLKVADWQFGAAADFIEAGNGIWVFTGNYGGFLRHEF